MRRQLGLSWFEPLTKERLLEVTELNLEGYSLRRLEGIEALVNLRMLDVSETLVTDITPLAHLTQLEALDLQNDGVEDITPLAHLTRLRWLRLKDNPVQDVSALSQLTRLERLDLSGTRVTELGR